MVGAPVRLCTKRMGARSLRMKQEKLQRPVRLLQHEVLIASPPMPISSFAYPPIFLSPSSFDPFTPSPSPIPAAGSNHRSVPTAAIVGGGIAGVVALAVTAAVISTVTGKVGLCCLLGPACKLFDSSLCGYLPAPCSSKLKSLCSTLSKWNPARKAASNKAASNADAGPDDGGMDLYEVLAGGSRNTVVKVESGAAAAAHSLAKSPLREVVKGHGDEQGTSAHAFLVTSVSDFAESELKKQKEIMLQPVNQNIVKAQGFTQDFLSVTDKISDDLRGLKQSTDAHLNEVSKLRANAEYDMKASTEAIANEHAAGMKRLQKLQDWPVLRLEEEVVQLHRTLGKPTRTSSKEEDHELEEGGGGGGAAKQRVFLGRSGPAYIVESASDAANYTELQLEEKGATSYTQQLAQVPHKDIEIGGAPTSSGAHHNPAGSTSSMALVPIDTGDKVTNNPTLTPGGTIVPLPMKTIIAPSVPGRTVTSATKADQWTEASEDDVIKGKQIIAKGKRPSNLGHVSFSCEISAHRLRFFTSCRSGGTFGSPPASPPAPPHHNNYNNVSNNYSNYDHSINTKGNDHYKNNNQPISGNYYVPLYNGLQLATIDHTRDPNKSHYNLMHQQFHPSQSLLVQSTTRPNIEMLHHNPPPSESPAIPQASSIHDYGSPFEGVL